MVDDFAANNSTTGRVFNNNSTTGNIEVNGDRDWFGVFLYENVRYTIDVEGQATARGTLNDPYLYEIHNSSGAAIPSTTDDDSGVGLNSLLSYRPTYTGDHFLHVGAFVDASTGTYRVSVQGDAPSSAPFFEPVAEPAPAPEPVFEAQTFRLFLGSRDSNADQGSAGRHYFLFAIGNTPVLEENAFSVAGFLGYGQGYTFGATVVAGSAKAYGSELLDSNTSDSTILAASRDAEALQEFMENRTIGSSNERLSFTELSGVNEQTLSSLIALKNNFIASNAFAPPGAGGSTPIVSSASWVENILDLVGIPMSSNLENFFDN